MSPNTALGVGTVLLAGPAAEDLPELSVYSNALAAIHTTLKRLAETGELRTAAAAAPGKLGYVWVRSPNTATLTLDNARITAEIDKTQTRRRGKR